MKNSGVVWTALICAVAFVSSLVIGPTMPAIVPTHWNAAGHPDGYGGKATLLWLVPCIMLGITLMTWGLPYLSPKKFAIEPFMKTYVVIMVAVQLLELSVHLLVLKGAVSPSFNLTRWIMPVMFVFFAVMGNWMGKVRQNYFMGVRTPWTLADERVWEKTHREASYLWVWGGLTGAVISALPSTIWVSVAWLLAMCLWPIFRSYIIARALGVVPGSAAPGT